MANQEAGTPALDIREFVESGYLQEVNRRFLHPLGLALAVSAEQGSNGEMVDFRLTGVWDFRDDPEGIYFGGEIDAAKVRRINAEWQQRAMTRRDALGFIVEPAPQTATITAADPQAHRPEFLEWLRAHDINPNDVFRVEIEGSTMAVHRYRRNSSGKAFIEDGQVAVEEPLTVLLASPCPVL